MPESEPPDLAGEDIEAVTKAVWQVIIALADGEIGDLGDVVRAWLDVTVRPVLGLSGYDDHLAEDEWRSAYSDAQQLRLARDHERDRLLAAMADIAAAVMPGIGHGGHYEHVVTVTEAVVFERDRLRDARAAALPPHHDDALLTLAQAAEVLSVSYSTITKWTSRGEFCPQAFKLPNGEYRVRYRDLIRWALSMRGDDR